LFCSDKRIYYGKQNHKNKEYNRVVVSNFVLFAFVHFFVFHRYFSINFFQGKIILKGLEKDGGVRGGRKEPFLKRFLLPPRKYIQLYSLTVGGSFCR
jgi:hypothetical protein